MEILDMYVSGIVISAAFLVMLRYKIVTMLIETCQPAKDDSKKVLREKQENRIVLRTVQPHVLAILLSIFWVVTVPVLLVTPVALYIIHQSEGE